MRRNWLVFRNNGERVGPLAIPEIIAALRQGRIEFFDHARKDGSEVLRKISEIEEIIREYDITNRDAANHDKTKVMAAPKPLAPMPFPSNAPHPKRRQSDRQPPGKAAVLPRILYVALGACLAIGVLVLSRELPRVIEKKMLERKQLDTHLELRRIPLGGEDNSEVVISVKEGSKPKVWQDNLHPEEGRTEKIGFDPRVAPMAHLNGIEQYDGQVVTLGPLTFVPEELLACEIKCSLTMQDPENRVVNVKFFKAAYLPQLKGRSSGVYIRGQLGDGGKNLYLSETPLPSKPPK